MATSRDCSPFGIETLRLDPQVLPPRTPGPLGMRDAADPNVAAAPGDTPGVLGIRDYADPAARLRLVPPLLPLDFAESEAYQEFQGSALECQIRYAKLAGNEFFPAVPENELEVVEGSHKLRKKAAVQCRQLLSQERADLEKEKNATAKKRKEEQDQDAKAAKAKGEVPVTEVKGIGISSAYRDFKRDESIWKSAFLKYYKQTYYDRFWLKGGPHGNAAVKLQALYTGKRKAAPGFSNHSKGIAVDFWTREGNELLVAKTGKKKGDLEIINERWKRSWLHRWLVKHAASYGFYPIGSEAWHWEFRE